VDAESARPLVVARPRRGGDWASLGRIETAEMDSLETCDRTRKRRDDVEIEDQPDRVVATRIDVAG